MVAPKYYDNTIWTNYIIGVLENHIMPKIIVLFHGHLQNTQQWERIESAVDRHENITIIKVK